MAVSPSAPSARRPPWRRLAVALGVGAVLAAAALRLASALDSPTGSAPADPSQPIVAGPVVAPGQQLTGGASSLPPLRLVLDHSPPGNIGDLPAAEQIPRLRALVGEGAAPRRLVELGSVQQAQGTARRRSAPTARRCAGDPGDLAARLGVVMVDGATGSAGLKRAAARLPDAGPAAPRQPDRAVQPGLGRGLPPRRAAGAHLVGPDGGARRLDPPRAGRPPARNRAGQGEEQPLKSPRRGSAPGRTSSIRHFWVPTLA